MNKMIKASLAGTAGVALLTGGLGTYATWTDAAGVEGHDIQSGVLDITAGAVVWDDESTTSANDWTTSDLLVPGDTVSRTQTFNVTGTGRNLEGAITLTSGAVDKGTFGEGLLGVEVDVISQDAEIIESTEVPNSFAFTAPFDTGTLTAVVTYTFAEGATAQQAQNATATMAESTLNITQTPVAP